MKTSKPGEFENFGLALIQEASKALRIILPATPLIYSPRLSEAYGCDLYLKLEIFQPVGSFKIRGATYFISRIPDVDRKKGVIAASAGNHAQGVAWGSKYYQTSALIVMPTTASLNKIESTVALGAEVRLEGNTYDEAYQAALRISAETDRTYVHAFENEYVSAGQGTLGLEILEQLPEVDCVISSIGGGGMMAGLAYGLKELKPSVQLFGCQARGAAAMAKSLLSGQALSTETVQTFADGIAVKKASPKMLSLLHGRVEDCVEVEEEAIAMSLLKLVEKAKVLVEGSSAISLAAVEQLRDRLKGKKTVLVMSGGNIDLNILSRIIDRGMVLSGRRLRISIRVGDRPGALLRLTECLAQEGANILQVIHDRNEPSVHLDETGVELTLETRGETHNRQILAALEKVSRSVHLVS